MVSTESTGRNCVCALSAHVIQVDRPCREHVSITVDADGMPESRAGQFVEIACATADSLESGDRPVEWSDGHPPPLDAVNILERKPFVRRPFSIADRFRSPSGTDCLTVLSREIGVGTQFLDRVRVGDKLDLTGPLGNGFDLSSIDCPLQLVGGGVGIPPLLYLARALAERKAEEVTCVFGAMTGDLLAIRREGEVPTDGRARPCVRLPGAAAFPAILTTDDGTLGLRGRVTDGMAAIAGRSNGRAYCVFACGPEPMLHAVARFCRARGWDCQLCIEKYMGCGLGTCLSCVVKKADSTRPAGWRWALTCTDGPVFKRDELLEFRD